MDGNEEIISNSVGTYNTFIKILICITHQLINILYTLF